MRLSLDTAAVARMCGTTDQHIRKLARLGRIPHYRVGALYKFDPAEIAGWLEASRVEPRAKASA